MIYRPVFLVLHLTLAQNPNLLGLECSVPFHILAGFNSIVLFSPGHGHGCDSEERGPEAIKATLGLHVVGGQRGL